MDRPYTILLVVAVILAVIIIFSRNYNQKRESFDCLSQCPYNRYYGNWNYSPYYTPLPVNEDSYRHYYSDLPCLENKWLV